MKIQHATYVLTHAKPVMEQDKIAVILVFSILFYKMTIHAIILAFKKVSGMIPCREFVFPAILIVKPALEHLIQIALPANQIFTFLIKNNVYLNVLFSFGLIIKIIAAHLVAVFVYHVMEEKVINATLANLTILF